MQLQLSFLLHFVMLLFSAMVQYCGLMMVLCIFAKGAIKEALKRLSLIFGVLEHAEIQYLKTVKVVQASSTSQKPVSSRNPLMTRPLLEVWRWEEKRSTED